ncbi:hypothetical protein [Oceanicaulis sp. UBA6590]|uniref:hypothetical protein n=1 Tax=Oceanicaulis sp. UBA6590 TaxID=1947008 RepID=UPI0025F2EE54|nr:hypothetical protein [Oceanicaulis sp. UBA6590]|tara:strand:- start:514 stop:1128 length:615 start_codon:yes stop_codon:yes gene_type:complete
MSSSGDDETWATRVREICVRWNEAEGMIKVAEQVNGEIINPAIYELRYAGRRIVEALKCHEEGDIDKRNNLLHDADFDCCRAKHDAIDAITAKVANDMALATKKLGEDNVLQHFPNITKMYRTIKSVRSKIKISREDRENRDAIYETLGAGDIPELVELYEEFLGSEDLLKAAARKNMIGRNVAYVVTGLSLVIAAFSTWVGLF